MILNRSYLNNFSPLLLLNLETHINFLNILSFLSNANMDDNKNAHRLDLETRKITEILGVAPIDAFLQYRKPEHLSQHGLRKLRKLAKQVRSVGAVKAALTAAIDARQENSSAADFQSRPNITLADVDIAIQVTKPASLAANAPAETEKRKRDRDVSPAPPAAKGSKAKKTIVLDSDDEEDAPEQVSEAVTKRTRPMRSRRGGEEAEEPDVMEKKKRGVYSKEQLLQLCDLSGVTLPIDVVCLLPVL